MTMSPSQETQPSQRRKREHTHMAECSSALSILGSRRPFGVTKACWGLDGALENTEVSDGQLWQC